MSASRRYVGPAVLLLASLGLAQIPPLTFIDLPQRGMMSAFSAGIVFDNNPGVIVHKRQGLPARLDTFAGSGSSFVSEYSGEAVRARLSLQAGLPPGTLIPPLVFDAISSCNDLLPLVWVTGTGPGAGTFRIVNAAAQSWATLYLSLRGPGIDPADIYGYYSENLGFPAQLKSAIYREALRADYVAGTVPVPGPTNRIVGLDVAMGLIHDNRGFKEPHVLDCVDRMFFSLTNASAAQLQATGAIPGAAIDGATIFEAQYDHGTGQVSAVMVHRLGSSFGLAAGSDIDALGMGVVTASTSASSTNVPLTPGTMMYLISTTRNPAQPGEELIAVGTPLQMPEMRGPLRAHNGQPLVGPGAPPPFDDQSILVEGLCEMDPEVPAGTMSFGVPRPNPLAAQPSPLNLSLTASWSAINPPVDNFLLTGVVSGVGQLGPASVFLAVRNIGINQWDLFALPMRDATADGGAYSFEKKLIYAWNGPAGLGTSNEYEVFVATLPLNATTPTFDYTHSSWLRRRYVP